VILWESGEQAGIVGVGKVAGYPAEMIVPPEEDEFTLDRKSEAGAATRVLVKARAIAHIAKADVASIAGMDEHAILTGPMGTVFPLEAVLWESLREAFPALAQAADVPIPDVEIGWPKAFAWKDRRKSVHPLPGGQESYPETLAGILDRVRQVQPERSELEAWLASSYSNSALRSKYSIDFLTRVGLLAGGAARVALTAEAEHWLADLRPDYLVALVHSRVRFIGELLQALDQPRSAEDLLKVANAQYAMGWNTRAQIDRRRYLLQGFEMIAADEDGRLALTELGTSVLGQLQIQDPIAIPEPAVEVAVQDDVAAATEVIDRGGADLGIRLVDAASDTSDPARFEKLAAEAFAYLGYDSAWLGGAGKTDVLLVAPLGPDEGYRVIIDCKTTTHDGVQDHQIDWITLKDHKTQHDADYVAVLGPAFKGKRVRERAVDNSVTLFDAETLVGLLLQHARTPLGLDVYRELFTAPEAEDPAGSLAEAAEELGRWQRLVGQVTRTLVELESVEGPLQAKDLYWNLKAKTDEDIPFTVEEIQAVLDALSSPAVGVLRSVEDGHATLGSRATMAARLRELAAAVSRDDLDGSSSIAEPDRH
jgi:hypothetical protein